jgi:hypothetical protein
MKILINSMDQYFLVELKPEVVKKKLWEIVILIHSLILIKVGPQLCCYLIGITNCLNFSELGS